MQRREVGGAVDSVWMIGGYLAKGIRRSCLHLLHRWIFLLRVAADRWSLRSVVWKGICSLAAANADDDDDDDDTRNDHDYESAERK